MLSEKQAELAKLMERINTKKQKQNPHAPPALRFASEMSVRDLISTGNLAVDRALGGGVKKGLLIEVAGDQGTGKSSFFMEWIADVQKNGGQCLYFLTEGKFDETTARLVGVDLDKLTIISCMGYVEKHLDDLKSLLWDEEKEIPRNLFDLIVIDSISAFEAKLELDSIDAKGIEGDTVGVQARLMSKLFRVIVGGGMVGDAVIGWISQTREKIVLMGDNRASTGGKSPGFYATYRLWFRSERVKEKTQVIGQIVHFAVQKNNSGYAPPFKTGQYTVYFGKGVDHIGGLVDACCEDRAINPESSPMRGNPATGRFEWINTETGEAEKIVGRESLKKFVNEKPEAYQAIKTMYLEGGN